MNHTKYQPQPEPNIRQACAVLRESATFAGPGIDPFE